MLYIIIVIITLIIIYAYCGGGKGGFFALAFSSITVPMASSVT
jgi:hypothetical protein